MCVFTETQVYLHLDVCHHTYHSHNNTRLLPSLRKAKIRFDLDTYKGVHTHIHTYTSTHTQKAGIFFSFSPLSVSLFIKVHVCLCVCLCVCVTRKRKVSLSSVESAVSFFVPFFCSTTPQTTKQHTISKTKKAVPYRLSPQSSCIIVASFSKFI